MKKKYFYYILLLLFNTSILFGQKVTLTPLLVNGKSYTSGPINLESTSTSSVTLNVKVESPTATGNDGTINVYYYKASALGGNIATGGNGGSLIFGGGKIANRQFVISLNWYEFATSGGSLYAEYKNATGIIYKSASIAIIKNATVGGGTLTPPADAPNPAKIANTLCCNQTVRLGERPQTITGSQYSNPYANYSYGINESWSANGNRTIKFLNFKSSALNIDYITDPQNFTITRSLGYNNTSNLTNKSNTITITVVPSPITANIISINNPPNEDGFAEIINTNPKEIAGYRSTINLNTLQDPFNTPKRDDKHASIERYEWEYGLTNKTYPTVNDWLTIPNENSTSLNSSSLPILNNSEEIFYLVRRIAIYKDLRITSNYLKVVLRSVRKNNTICCDQILYVSPSDEIESPSLLTGPEAFSDKGRYLFYRWQSQSIGNRNEPKGNWSNINGATSKDYFPPALQVIPNNDSRGGNTIPEYNYRRIATDNTYNGETYYSNEISLTYTYRSKTPTSSIIVYPNPATSIINIEDKNNTFTARSSISIVNTMGIVVSSNNFSIINPNLISIDISNLIIGTYFLNVQTFVNGRRNTKQFTFIKN